MGGSRGESSFSEGGEGHCEPLHRFPDWLRLLHRVAVECWPKRTAPSRCLTEGVVAAANFGICLSLNESNCWELPEFRIVPWKRERKDGAVTGSAECCPLQGDGDVTEVWSWEGAEGCGEGTAGSRQAGLGQEGPQRSRDLTCSFYRWENPDAVGKALAQGHMGGPSEAAWLP